MEAFEYASPKTVQEAARLLGSTWGGTEILAGGTDLISAMKDRITTPKRVVSLKNVKGLDRIEYNGRSGLRIGALATIRQLLDDKTAQQQYPGLVQAADGIRGEQMRHMGTVGGELLQRPRDWYFRNGYGLLAQHEGKSLIPDGQNVYAAILGNSGPAYFVNPSSLAPILIALNAKVTLQGPSGQREVELSKFYKTPQSEDEREYVIQPNEILTEIIVPPAAGAKTATYEIREKEGLDWPLVAAAVALQMDGDSVKSARVVLGHVAPVPWPSPEAEQELQGKSLSEDVAESAGKAAVSNARPLSQNGYKVQLARVAVKRALMRAVKGEA
ncbi:MAG TPA: FAD binding domain-containing protein [Terriglobia bacterium]|jgi:xanthine dehydrogenase YagS FAD-binding subunit|nr:FAD binding domain-containing protein [Terriglobia bacterium]